MKFNVEGTEIRIEMLILEEIRIDSSYQRPVKKRFVSAIANHFDPTIVGVLHVSQNRLGDYYVWDGQHRLLAMRERGIKSWPCVITDKTKMESAGAFSQANGGRIAMTPYNNYVAKIVAKDTIALQIKRATERYGLVVSASKSGPKVITCISVLTAITRRNGERFLNDVLGFITNCWKDEKDSYRGIVLATIALLGMKYSNFLKEKDFVKSLEKKSLGKLIAIANYDARQTTKGVVTCLSDSIKKCVSQSKLIESETSKNPPLAKGTPEIEARQDCQSLVRYGEGSRSSANPSVFSKSELYANNLEGNV